MLYKIFGHNSYCNSFPSATFALFELVTLVLTRGVAKLHNDLLVCNQFILKLCVLV